MVVVVVVVGRHCWRLSRREGSKNKDLCQFHGRHDQRAVDVAVVVVVGVCVPFLSGVDVFRAQMFSVYEDEMHTGTSRRLLVRSRVTTPPSHCLPYN